MKIKEAREKAGITQKELSERTGINIRQIQKMESGEIEVQNVTAKNFMTIASALNVSPYDLIEKEE